MKNQALKLNTTSLTPNTKNQQYSLASTLNSILMRELSLQQLTADEAEKYFNSFPIHINKRNNLQKLTQRIDIWKSTSK